MILRPFWVDMIQKAWDRSQIILLSGVPGVGKTSLCKSLAGIFYLDCKLPSARNQLATLRSFFENHSKQPIVLDDFPALTNAVDVLKMAVDVFPETKLILIAEYFSPSFFEKIANIQQLKKSEINLTSIIESERIIFGLSDIQQRLFQGGLPIMFHEQLPHENLYLTWLDNFCAKTIFLQFSIEKHEAFRKFTELLLAQSGILFEATKFVADCQTSRQTIMKYLKILAANQFVHVLKPFNSKKPTEIITAPKVYGFDTGFICYAKGWLHLRNEDLNLLWKHYILNELKAHLQNYPFFYWRNKQKQEIDFVFQMPGSTNVMAIICQWQAQTFNANELKVFRQHYHNGPNFVVAFDMREPQQRIKDDLILHFIGIKDLEKYIYSRL